MEIAEKIGSGEPIAVGPVRLDGAAMLAPMSGVSDLGMRRAARRFGAALAFSEMVAAETYLDGDVEASMRAEGEGVVAARGATRRPRAAAPWRETARRVEDAGAAIIDINMGCPARRVSGALAGAALMRDLDHAERVVVRGRRGGVRPGDAEDAPRLGRRRDQRARTRPSAPSAPACAW